MRVLGFGFLYALAVAVEAEFVSNLMSKNSIKKASQPFLLFGRILSDPNEHHRRPSRVHSLVQQYQTGSSSTSSREGQVVSGERDEDWLTRNALLVG